MANCKNCGAPLPPRTIVCEYCNTRNAVDLKGFKTEGDDGAHSERICPRCNIPLKTVSLQIEGNVQIETCSQCMGLFFDPGELELMLDKAVSNVYVIDTEKLNNLDNVRSSQEYPVGYIKCPVCRKLMHRINYKAKSGVIIDQCKNDGVWLDGGELRDLMEWVKAGGQILQQQTHEEYERVKKEIDKKQREHIREAAQKTGYTAPPQKMSPYRREPYYPGGDGFGGFANRRGDGFDLLGIVGRIVSGLLRA